jgi:hypothetical protein
MMVWNSVDDDALMIFRGLVGIGRHPDYSGMRGDKVKPGSA